MKSQSEKAHHHIQVNPPDFEELMKSNELRIAIIGSAKIDVYLDILLSAAMVKDSRFVESLLDGVNFAAKIKIAYAFKLIDKETRRDLDCIRNIRNKFAHNMAQEMSFEHEDVRKNYNELSTIKKNMGTVRRPTDLFNQAITENIQRLHMKALSQYTAFKKAFKRDSRT